jgi:hypothetical protein
MVLGLFAAELAGAIHAGERCLAVGWPLGHAGRKHFAGTAVFGEDGTLRGRARATWVEIAGADG